MPAVASIEITKSEVTSSALDLSQWEKATGLVVYLELVSTTIINLCTSGLVSLFPSQYPGHILTRFCRGRGPQGVGERLAREVLRRTVRLERAGATG